MKDLKGFSKIDNNLLFNNDLSPYSKLTLTMLNYYTRNGKGKCFARKTTLSKMIGISLYKLRKALDELEQLGLIHIDRPGLGNADVIRIKNLKPECLKTPHQPSTIIEEEVKEEEEENISTKDVDSITPKEDEPAPDKHLEPDTSKISPNSGRQPRQTPPTKPKHLNTLKTITTKIRPLLKDNSYNHFISYNHFFSNISVIDETNDTISLATPNDEIIANFIQEQYSSKLGKILGKDVKISSIDIAIKQVKVIG